MNLKQLQDKLIAVARKNPPGEQVPYAFEKRIMHRLAGAKPLNHWALWSGPMWRAAISCVAITVLCGLWTLTSHRAPDNQESFSQAFESTVFAPPHSEDAW